MLDLQTEKKAREWLDACLALRREHTDASADLIRNFVGQDYRSSFCDENDNFENHAYEWCVNIVPTYVSANPLVTVRDMDIEDEQTELLTRMLRSFTSQTNPFRAFRAVALDCQFDFGVLAVDTERTPGLRFKSEYEPVRPVIRRLSPRQYFRDIDQPTHGYARGEGHLLVKSKAAMLGQLGADGRPRYREVELESCSPLAGLDEFRDDMLQDGFRISDGDDDLILVAEIFNRDTGTWQSFCPGNSGGVFLTDERKYEGADDGPYVMAEIQEVPDQVYPLPALAVTKRIVQELNKLRLAASNDVATAKRFTIVGAKNTEILANVRDAPSGSVLTAAGFNGQIATVDTGGVNPEIYKATGVVREGLDRLCGLTDSIRGNLTGVTRGEADLAANYASARMDAGKLMFKYAIAEAYRRVLQLANKRTDMVMPMAYRDPQSGEMVRSVFYGGPKGNLGVRDQSYPFDPVYTCSIEPHSMEYVNRASRRAELRDAQTQFLAIAQAMKADPAIRGRRMIDDLFDTLEMPKTSERYYDFQAAAEMLQRGMMLEQQQMAAGGAN